MDVDFELIKTALHWRFSQPALGPCPPRVVQGIVDRCYSGEADAIHAVVMDRANRYYLAGCPVELSAQCVSNRVDVYIGDRGIGITSEEAAGMRPFQQWRRSQNEQQGLGLGFSIARSLAALNESNVVIAPREGGGAIVTVSLPTILG